MAVLGFLKSGFTTDKGELDDARLSAFLIVLTFIVNSVYSAFICHIWDAQQFGIGAGALAAGIGVWFGQRKDN